MKELENKTVFKNYIQEQQRLHPAMEPQDMVKLCYQAAFGAEHLLTDLEGAWKYLEQEFAAVTADDSPLYEQIHPQAARINLAAWKREKLPLKWLFGMFTENVSLTQEKTAQQESFQSCLAIAGENASFGETQWNSYLQTYPAEQPIPLHHSEAYREKEHPAYRLVNSRLLRLLPLLQRINSLPEGQKVIALDGRCASGKTTLAAQLEKITGAGVVHADDFFLPGALRTKERLEEAGGNIHYERILQQVIPFIGQKEPFSYGRFDCSKMEIGEQRSVPEGEIRILEGAYSCHPILGEYMSLRVFSDIDSKTQLERIESREGKAALQAFEAKWIPMEESYFSAFQIKEKADLIV